MFPFIFVNFSRVLSHLNAHHRTWKLVYMSYNNNYTKVDGISWLIVISWAQPVK
jgi:hypothetical protein